MLNAEELFAPLGQSDQEVFINQWSPEILRELALIIVEQEIKDSFDDEMEAEVLKGRLLQSAGEINATDPEQKFKLTLEKLTWLTGFTKPELFLLYRLSSGKTPDLLKVAKTIPYLKDNQSKANALRIETAIAGEKEFSSTVDFNLFINRLRSLRLLINSAVEGKITKASTDRVKEERGERETVEYSQAAKRIFKIIETNRGVIDRKRFIEAVGLAKEVKIRRKNYHFHCQNFPFGECFADLEGDEKKKTFNYASGFMEDLINRGGKIPKDFCLDLGSLLCNVENKVLRKAYWRRTAVSFFNYFIMDKVDLEPSYSADTDRWIADIFAKLAENDLICITENNEKEPLVEIGPETVGIIKKRNPIF